MLVDVVFFGLPFCAALCLATIAWREGNPKFWQCSFALLAYLAFYLLGGREVLVYLLAGLCMGSGWAGLSY